MKLPKFLKIIIGLATAWMVAFPFVYLVFVIAMMFGAPLIGTFDDAESALFFVVFAFFILAAIFTAFLQMALLPFYAAHMIVNKAAKEDLRVAFAVGLFLLPVVALPVYYVACVWPDQPPKWAAAHGLQ